MYCVTVWFWKFQKAHKSEYKNTENKFFVLSWELYRS